MRSPLYPLLVFLIVGSLAFGHDALLRQDGSLSSGDIRWETGAYVDWFTVNVEADTRLRILAVSVDFPPLVLTDTPEAGIQSGSSTLGASVAALRVQERGTVRVGITSASRDDTPVDGRYTILVEALEPEPPVRVGETRTGMLGPGDETTEGRYVDTYSVPVAAGRRTAITMNSDEFDAYLSITLPSGELVEVDDTFGTNPSYQFIPADSSSLEVVATSLSGDTEGAYTLSVDTFEEPRRMVIGAAIRDNLSATDEMVAGNYVDSFVLDAPEGSRAVISLGSDEFDTMLILVGHAVGMLTNDDAGEGSTDSQLPYTFFPGGPVVIQVASYDSGATGAYSLTVDEAPPLVEVLSGETIEGRLSESDTLRDGSYADEYVLRGRLGAAFRVQLASEDFDAYLTVQDSNGNVTENDDAGDSTNAAVEYTFDGATMLRIVVTAFGQGETGSYRLSVEPIVAPGR